MQLDHSLQSSKTVQGVLLLPATRSRTATLLRLHPNHQLLNGLNFVESSSKAGFLHVTGGVYKTN
jgi:hypothetical protein